MWKGREEGGDKKKKNSEPQLRAVPTDCPKVQVCSRLLCWCMCLLPPRRPHASCLLLHGAQLSASFSFTVTSMKTAFTCCGRAVDNIQSNTADAVREIRWKKLISLFFFLFYFISFFCLFWNVHQVKSSCLALFWHLRFLIWPFAAGRHNPTDQVMCATSWTYFALSFSNAWRFRSWM